MRDTVEWADLVAQVVENLGSAQFSPLEMQRMAPLEMERGGESPLFEEESYQEIAKW